MVRPVNPIGLLDWIKYSSNSCAVIADAMLLFVPYLTDPVYVKFTIFFSHRSSVKCYFRVVKKWMLKVKHHESKLTPWYKKR
jgi:hypothetical protein